MCVSWKGFMYICKVSGQKKSFHIHTINLVKKLNMSNYWILKS